MINSLQHKRIIGGGIKLLTMMFMLVSLLASCTDKTVDGYTGQLTIAVSYGTSSKAISFDPEDGYPAAISHYTIEVYDEEDERVARTADKLPFTGGSGRFTVPGLITGTYRIEAEGYIQRPAQMSISRLLLERRRLQ